ncbi:MULTISPECIES: hypothetical protein [unclassified Corallococcus]|uniref:hypothetical protein n=1 Tax=unclassified Corallococcus TaxID=2685029 RepID=UPI001A8D8773|nr:MULTISPECIES: hypothetical protein [unclassified Corallococcus]MBN9685013.1 hypothetical protein [Corallococcus sp. NCSPR001]WAS83527.1 hypothetical protein O0N60_29955 [Corallococcus sp. NCRR]
MTSGRFAPLAAVATAVVSSTFLLLGPAGCDEKSQGAACTDNCPTVEGNYPLTFAGDAGLPAECVNLNVKELVDGEVLNIQRGEGGMLTGTLAGVALTGQVYANGALNLTGLPLPGGDGGVSTIYTLTATHTGAAPTEDGGVGPGSLSGNFNGQFSRVQGTSALRCNVARPFTATRQ